MVGSGGMGVVYEAWDERLERRVALKVLHPHLTAGPGSQERLLHEARLAARIEHPGVVRIYGIHEHEGALALEMQFVEGTPLNRLLAARPLSPTQAADLLHQVLDALAACHAQGVIHGDLKPGNLLVTADGKVLLTDFGISRAFHADDSAACPSVSLSGPLWGTPQYSPPEAWDGEQPTPQWDLYALGVLAHEALAGELPFSAQTPAVLMREKLDRSHTPIRTHRSDLTPEFADLMDALKAQVPSERPATAEAALEQLRAAPESRRELTTATQPFRHKVQPAPENKSTLGHGTPYPRIESTPPASQMVRPWKLHLAWVAVLALALAATLAYRTPRSNPEAQNAIVIPPVGKPGEVLDLMVAKDTAYFSYDDGQHGRELWCAKPDGQAEMLADITPGAASSNPHRFISRPAGGILFAATTPDFGEEPWFCGKGSSSHAVWMLKDIVPGTLGSMPFPVATWDQVFMFYATTLQQGTELWLSTTIEGQTGIQRDLSQGSGNSQPLSPKVLADGDGAYFIAMGGPPPRWQLWRYTHSTGSVQSIGSVQEETGEMVQLNGTLLLSVSDTEHGAEFWVHRGGNDGVQLFADLWPGPEGSDPQQLFVWKDAIYFQAKSKGHGAELWKSDGTPEGTAELLDIAPGAEGSSPFGFVVAGDHLYFRADDLAHGRELWVTDGTALGTRLVCDLRPGLDDSHPYSIAAIGGRLFFSADDGARGEELWSLDTTAENALPQLVKDLQPGMASSEPHNLTATGETSGIFVYKTTSGDAIMRLEVDGNNIRLLPCSGLQHPPVIL